MSTIKKNSMESCKHSNQKREDNERMNAFTELLRAYERQADEATRTNENDYANALQDLSSAITYAVLKKLCNVGGEVREGQKVGDSSAPIFKLRRSVAADINNLSALNNAVNSATELMPDASGDMVSTVVDKNARDSIYKLLNRNISDGYDLIHDALVTLLDETEKQRERGGLDAPDWMEQPYTVRQLKKKVYIKTEDSVNGWEDKETTPIQQVFKAVRRSVQNNRTMQIASHVYTYIEDVAKDSESNTETEIYKRLPKYSLLADEVTDFNGAVTAVTASIETDKKLNELVQKMQLSKQQALILKYRLCGHGRKAIATALGVRDDNVKVQLKRMQDKARELGLLPNE